MSLPTDGFINEDSLEKINGGANNNKKMTDKAYYCPNCHKNQKFMIYSGNRAQCPTCPYKIEV